MNQLRTSVTIGRSRSDVYDELNASKSVWHLAVDGLLYDSRADTGPASLKPPRPDVVVVIPAGDTLFCHVHLVAQISFDSSDRVAEFGQRIAKRSACRPRLSRVTCDDVRAHAPCTASPAASHRRTLTSSHDTTRTMPPPLWAARWNLRHVCVQDVRRDEEDDFALVV